MKKKLHMLVALALVFSMSFAGCGGSNSGSDGGSSTPAEGGNSTTETSESKEGGTFIIRGSSDPMSFNPDIIGDDSLYPIAQNMFHRLAGLDVSKQTLVPEAAKEWSYNEDATKLTFILRDDLKWTDGEPLNSEDVKYTFDTIKANPSYYFSARMNIVDSIETPDDYTVIFNLNTPDASFASILGWYSTFILPEHVFNNGQTWEENPASKDPVTSGPFMLESFKQGESVILKKNPDYPEPAKLDRLIFTMIPDEATAIQALLNGEIDFYENFPASSMAELEANPNLRVVVNEYPSPMRIVFNLKDEKIADVAVRKAIATALDREEISQKVFQGIQKPERCMYPSMISWAANTEDLAPDFNIEEAIKILEDAGYTKDANGYYVSGLTLDVFEGGGYPDTAKLLKASCEKAGIEIIVQVHEYNAWNQKVVLDKDFMIEMQGGFMGPDPAALINRIGSDQSLNCGGYSNSQVDELLEKGSATSNQDERAKYYKEAQKILAEELPYFNIVSFAGPEANSTNFVNLPYDGADKWAWANYSHTEKVN